MNELLLGIVLSVLPIFELRGGLPLAVNYALRKNIPIFFVFFLIVALNIAVIFFVFLFLDFVHYKLMRLSVYNRLFNFYVKKLQKRVDKVERRMDMLGFFALTLFVLIPLPVTGAYTGCLIAWLLDLNRKKSILAISTGVLGAGLIILFASLGIISGLR